MRDVCIERIAVVQGAPGAAIQYLFQALADRRSSSLRIAGVIAESHGLADRTCSAGYLRRIGTGDRFSIFADPGPDAAVCHIEESGVAAAAEAVRHNIAAGCDLVLLSKFGKLERAGDGLWAAFKTAVDTRVPLLTSVSPAAAQAWEKLTGSGFTVLPADAAAIDAWVDAVRSRGGVPASSPAVY